MGTVSLRLLAGVKAAGGGIRLMAREWRKPALNPGERPLTPTH